MNTSIEGLAQARTTLLARMEPQCSTCDDLMCLDCVEGLAHDRCTRPCADCIVESLDWERSWEMSSIITELRGLDRLDQEIRGL